MKIAYVITLSSPVGGAQVHVRDLSDGFVKKGHTCEVFVGSEGVMTDWLKERSIRYHLVPFLKHSIHPVNDRRAVHALAEQLAGFKPDIVSTHSSKAGIVGRLAARKLGIPSIYTAHGWSFLNSTGPLTAFLGWQAEVYCARFTKKIITVSEHDRDLAIRKRLCDPAKIIAVHNGMPDVGALHFASPGEAARPVHLVMIARFATQKDHTTLLQALAPLGDLEWKLSLVGDGPDEQKVRDLVQRLGLNDRVVFVGSVKSVLDILKNAHVYILATLSEGLPRSIIEAMRAGLPIVSNRVAGIPEQVENGRNGFLHEVRDVNGLRDSLKRLILDPALRAKMGRESRKLYLERFTLERLVEETFSVYEQALGGR